MDMSMMTGTNMFQTTNMGLARIYWYIIAGVVGAFVVVRIVNYYDCWVRLRTRASASHEYPTRPKNEFLQTWATLTAVGRELSYPQLYIPFRGLQWLTPPPLGRVLMLLVYWSVLIGFMCAGAIIKDVEFWERIGFRNAWVTVTQLPLLYLMAGKSNIIGTITGVSHERLNWIHRWIARTMFVTASVHGWHFYNEYSIAGMTSYFFEMEPMGKYGIAAWSLLLWTCLVGMAPVRHLAYEVFVIQHIVTAVVLLYIVHMHVPAYAEYNVWFAIAALCLDRAVRFVMLIWQNVKFRPNPSRCKGGQRIGHQAQIRAVGDDITVITIKDVHFKWRAGQHLYLWMPWIGPLEQHPYTIACAHQLPETCICNSIQLVVRKHGGFSKRLHDRAVKLQASGKKNSYTAFVTGPLGEPARWDVYETLVLISASTGASFTLPILESVLQAGRRQQTICTKRIDFLLAAKKGEEIEYYVQRLHELIDEAKNVGIELKVHIAVTGDGKAISSVLPIASKVANGQTSSSSSSVDTPAPAPAPAPAACCSAPRVIDEKSQGQASKSAGEVVVVSDVEKVAVQGSAVQRHRTASSLASVDSHVHQLTSRPDIDAFIREPVEATGGETSVVVCGGKSLVSRTRNCVAKLSDERGVHKGTGAQGIHLHVEEYGF